MILGEHLPKGWDVLPIRRLLHKLDRPIRSDDGVVTAYRDGRVTLRTDRREVGYTLSSLENGYQAVEPGDLVFHALDGFAGAVGVSIARGKCTPVYHVCESSAIANGRYLSYALRAMASSGYLAAQAGNVRQRSVDFRTWESFARLEVPLPPVERQRVLSDLLDTETARIDDLMAKKRLLMASLGARTESLLSKVFDPFVVSNGEVPLKTLAELRVSNVDKKSYEGETPVRVCNYTDVYYNRLIGPELGFMEATATPQQVQRLTLRKGDVLITKDSETAEDIAAPALVASDLPGVVLGYHLALLRPRAAYPPFLYWALRSRRCRDAFSLAASGVTRFGLRQDAVGLVPVPIMDPAAQHEAVNAIERVVGRAEETSQHLMRQIALLVERRQALISSAVTGKVGIPGVVA